MSAAVRDMNAAVRDMDAAVRDMNAAVRDMNAAVRRSYVDPCRGRGLLFQASACEGGRILYGGRPSHFEQGKYVINILQREGVLGGICTYAYTCHLRVVLTGYLITIVGQTS